MKTPDYIVIGAMKCGTTTLAAQLGAQAGLFMTTPKEPNYFSDDDVFARGPDWYSALFDAAAPGDLLGEASTHYTKLPDRPDTLARMQAAVPNPRLVYMIRDPMARLVSHYIHAWSEGETAAPLSEALTALPRLVNYGLYGMQIAPYVQAYGADAILLTSLEALKADPEGELTRVARHIGHSGPVTWQESNEQENASGGRVRKLPLHGLVVDHPVSTALRRALVPKRLRTWVREQRKYRGRPEIPEQARPGLIARFAEDRAVLETIFPGSAALDLAYRKLA